MCTKVTAYTYAKKRAWASADSECETIAANCDSDAPGSGDSETCDDEDTGSSDLPWECDLSVKTTWWQSGSYAYAECTVTYKET